MCWDSSWSSRGTDMPWRHFASGVQKNARCFARQRPLRTRTQPRITLSLFDWHFHAFACGQLSTNCCDTLGGGRCMGAPCSRRHVSGGVRLTFSPRKKTKVGASVNPFSRHCLYHCYMSLFLEFIPWNNVVGPVVLLSSDLCRFWLPLSRLWSLPMWQRSTSRSTFRFRVTLQLIRWFWPTGLFTFLWVNEKSFTYVHFNR